ncbi:hypothetical protein BS17DRAFT_776415 [Gyrodon lividus]|nr:hypothetical protein BS17DRAFT_776415 [Gyrodon lividus]
MGGQPLPWNILSPRYLFSWLLALHSEPFIYLICRPAAFWFLISRGPSGGTGIREIRREYCLSTVRTTPSSTNEQLPAISRLSRYTHRRSFAQNVRNQLTGLFRQS